MSTVTEPYRTPAEMLFFEGNRHMQSGDALRAETCFREAVRIAPDFAGGYANLGFILDKKGEAAEAEVCYRRSLELDQGYAETHLNLGALLAGQKRFHEAEMAYNSAIVLRPQSPVAWSNLGVLYACNKREADAERCYRIAMDLDREYLNARFNLSYVLLRQGKFEEGWQCLEARDWYAALASHLTCPRWRGESLAGKSLLIGYEAGHGDMIQFSRYATVLKARGAKRITMICHPALKTLFAQLADVDAVLAFDEAIPASGWDCWTPPLSIPYYCRTGIDSIPAAIPYLRAPSDRIAKWAAMLPRRGVRVGLVWKGSRQFENDADRSLPSLEVLAPLATIAGVRLVSLQKGQGENEATHAPDGMQLTHLGSMIDDFADTAAIVEQLDLVICVDTAVAHLAGAMGKPCWILLPDYKTDWRWLTERTDSPWYPGVVRLFRQSAMGDWARVIVDVRVALAKLVDERTSDDDAFSEEDKSDSKVSPAPGESRPGVHE